jgi:hypothetical protein
MLRNSTGRARFSLTHQVGFVRVVVVVVTVVQPTG